VEQSIDGFIAKLGITYHILIPYKEDRHILLHLKVAKDVSLYIFEEKPKEKIVYGQATIIQGTRQVTIDTTNGDILDDPSKLRNNHISFHGSGVVKSATTRATGYPLRNLTKAGQICTVIFPHPSKLPVVSNLRQSDITINYPLDEKCPLAVNMIATPRSIVPRVNIPKAVYQWSYALVYERLLPKDDLVIVLHFYHSPGEWLLYKTTIHPMDVHQFEAETP
jgi:hypothetical protein